MGFFSFFRKYLNPEIFRQKKYRYTARPDADKASTPEDQRDFARHWISFPVIVSRTDSPAPADGEKTVLKDISGGGALFVSETPENYYPGQLLKISIMLDGTSDVKARIGTEATVIRIHHENQAQPQNQAQPAAGKKQKAGIAVQFDRSFEFERIDTHDFGPIG